MDPALHRSSRALLAAVLALSACTFAWSEDEPVLPLTGTPAGAGAFQKLNQAPAGRATLVEALDGATWAAFCEFWVMGSGNNGRNCRRMRVVRLGAPGEPQQEELLEGDGFFFRGHYLYIARDDMAAKTRTMTLHAPGEPTAMDASFTFPEGRAQISTNRDGDVFAYMVQDEATTEFSVHRRDGLHERHVPLPPGTDPSGDTGGEAPLLTAFTADGATLVARTADTQLVAYSTLDDGTLQLGPRTASFGLDDVRKAVLSVGPDGLSAIPLDGSAERLLAAGPLVQGSLGFGMEEFFFARADGLYRGLLDGSAPPALVAPGGARAFAVGPGGQLVHSRDPGNRYAGGAGDGWIGDRQLVERGRGISFSRDGARLRWLEHAATIDNYGDLTSARVDGGAPELLGINVAMYGELPDGRVIAIENAIFEGTWNRLVVIDEAAREKRWVLDSTSEFALSTDRQHLVADVITGASGYDILRVTP